MNWAKYFFYIEKIGIRYFVIAGFAFAIFYFLLKKKISYKKIQKKFPGTKDYAREIGYSITTITIFAFVPLLILNSPKISMHTFFYSDIKKYGWFYFFLAFPVMFFIHDTYFYWMHRLMHHKKLFKIFHLVHHHSTNPSPWAAYAFHPLHLFIFFFLMIVYNVYGHLGYELYPKGFNKSRIGKWINTSVNHNQHHQYFKGNYGLYFLWWDRWMHTIRSEYDEKFDTVKTSQKEESKILYASFK